MNSIMTVGPDTPTTTPKRKPIKYCPICQDRVSDQDRVVSDRVDLLSLYVHVARKHDDWSQSALAALME